MKFLIYLFFALSVWGCQVLPPYNNTVKSAFIIDNQLDTAITVFDTSSSHDEIRFFVAANDVEEAYIYEAPSAKAPLPVSIQQFRIEIDGCTVTLKREKLETYLVRNSEGRAGWDWVVDSTFIRDIGC